MKRTFLAALAITVAMVGLAYAAPAGARRGHAARHGQRACQARPHRRRNCRGHTKRRPGHPRAAVKPAPLGPSLPLGTTPTPTTPVTQTPGTPPTAPPARLQVGAREFQLTLSRPSIASGAAIVEFVNGGSDPHDLHIRPAAGGADVFGFDVAYPGDRPVDQALTLPPGQYVLYCSLPQHEALGMHATLTVR